MDRCVAGLFLVAIDGNGNITGMPFFGETAPTGIIVDMRTATVSFEKVFHVS